MPSIIPGYEYDIFISYQENILSQGFIEHDGKIEVNSEEGKGSEFVISIPVNS